MIPALRVHAGPPPPDLGLGSVVAAGLEWRDIEGRAAVRTASHSEGASVELVGVGTYAVHIQGALVEAWAVPGRSEHAVSVEFERSVLPLVLAYRGAQYLHASAVATDAGVIALCGRSGTGKSTLAAALANNGVNLWADDAVVFTAGVGSPPMTVRLPAVLRLDETSRRLVGPMDGAQWSPAGERRPFAGIVVLERVHGSSTSRIDALTGGSALAALLEHALCFALDGDHRARLVRAYAEVTAVLPISRLMFTPDVDAYSSLVGILRLLVA